MAEINLFNKYILKDLDSNMTDIQGNDKIKQQIDTILNVETLSFPGKPTYFSDMHKLLFELNDEVTHIILTDRLRYALSKYITEIDDVEVELEADDKTIKAIIRYFNTITQQNDIYRYPLLKENDNG